MLLSNCGVCTSKKSIAFNCFTCSVPIIFPKCKLNSAKNNLWKCNDIGLPTLKGDFNHLRHLSNSQRIPLQIPIALYQTRRNGALGEKQYEIIQQNPTSFLYKYWTAKKVDNNATFTIGFPTKTTFYGCMAK